MNALVDKGIRALNLGVSVESVAVHGLKLEIGNWEKMKRVYDLEVYKLAEELSDMIWQDFDRWNKKVQNTVGYQIMRSSTVQKHEGQISNF